MFRFFIAESEWRTIEAGLVQRAELLEAVVKDIYGDNRLVAEGIIPPELIAQNPRLGRARSSAPCHALAIT